MATIAIIVAALVLFLPWKQIASYTASAAKRYTPKLPSFNPLAIKVELPLWKVAILIGLFWFVSGHGLPSFKLPGLPSIPGIPSFTTKAKEATYVYEKDQGGVPPAVMSGLNKLNADRKILANSFEQNTVDGTGETPEQYKVPLEAAKKEGLPSLVATAGTRVLRVTKDPKTEEDVLKGVP